MTVHFGFDPAKTSQFNFNTCIKKIVKIKKTGAIFPISIRLSPDHCGKAQKLERLPGTRIKRLQRFGVIWDLSL